MTKKMTKLFGSRWGRVIVSAVFVGVLFLAIRASNTITFLNNDDTNIMHTLAGDFTGVPYTSHPFINVILGVVGSTLYSVMPGIPWWPMLHVAAMYLGLVAITSALIKGFRFKGLPLWIPFAVALSLIFCVYSYALVEMTFTLTAAILGTAALALILTFGMDTRDTYKPFWAVFVILFFMGACFVFRNSSGLSLLPFWGLALLYRYLTIASEVAETRRKKARRLLLTTAILSVSLSGLLLFLNQWGILLLNGSDFVSFDEARGRFMDYPHDTYQQNPELYASVDWDENLYEMAECRFFMDARITADALNAIVDGSSFYRLPFFQRLQKALELGVSTARGNGPLQYILVPMVLTLAIAALGFFRRPKGHVIPFAACCLFALGGFLASLYLCYTGRFPLRTFQLLAFPTVIGMVFTTLPLVMARCALSAELTRRAREVNLALTVIVFVSMFIVGFKTVHALDTNHPRETLRASRTLSSYVMEHPTNVYIRSPLTGYDIDPYITYTQKRPSNLMDWGGTSMHTGFQRRQIVLNDLDAFDPEIFKRDDVYFVSTVENHQARHFEDYMKENWGAVGLVEVERITAYLVVYRVAFPE